MAMQLSRVADALETIAAHLGASAPRVQPVPEPSQPPSPTIAEQSLEPTHRASEPSVTEQTKIDKPAEQHVNLSMFGR